MRAAGARLGLLAALLALAALAARAQRTTTYAPDVDGPGGWRRGRATFFGGDERFLANFPDRGPPPEYGFGNIRYGSCGFYQQARPAAAPASPACRRLRDSACRRGCRGFRRGSAPSRAGASCRLACWMRCWPFSCGCTSRHSLGGCVQSSWRKARSGAGVHEARLCARCKPTCCRWLLPLAAATAALAARRRGRPRLQQESQRLRGGGSCLAGRVGQHPNAPGAAPRMAVCSPLWRQVAREGAQARATLRPGARTTAEAVPVGKLAPWPSASSSRRTQRATRGSPGG